MHRLACALLMALLTAAPVAADYRDELATIRDEVAQMAAGEAEGSDAERLQRLIEVSYDYTMLEYPEFATYLGDPRGQDRWTDNSRPAIDQRNEDSRNWLAALEAIDRDALGENDRTNYDLLLNDARIDVAGQRFPGELLPMNQMGGPQQGPSQLMSLMRATRVEEYENMIARMEGVPTVVDNSIALMREGMEQGITPPAITLRDVPQQISNQLVDDPSESPLLVPFQQMPATIDSLQQDALRQRATTVYSEHVAPAYERLLAFTEEEYLPAARASIGLRDLPNGEAWYAHNVANMTTTDLTPEQIHEIGLAEVKRIRAEMMAIVEAEGYGTDFDGFMEFLRTDPQFYHDTPEALLAEYRDIAKRADPELVKVFGKLPRTPYGVVPVPDFAAPSQTTAYYQPGSLAAGRPGNFFANTYALDTRPRWEMEALTLHEGVPGHHFQIAIQQELDDVPWFRTVPNYTAFVEGWGLYSESLGVEMGFYKDPYSKFGQLTYEMWRAVRLVVDTGMHHLGWSREQAIEYFKANAPKQEHDITVEVDRYIVWPGQALAYKIGELKIKELRSFAEETLGDDFDIRAFHDEVLGRGAVPLSVLEANIREWVAAQQQAS